MSTYVLPQVLVFQDFTRVVAAAANPLRAHISGPHAHLIRYADDDERADGKLGFYDRLTDTPYAWPNRPAGATVNVAHTPTYCISPELCRHPTLRRSRPVNRQSPTARRWRVPAVPCAWRQPATV